MEENKSWHHLLRKLPEEVADPKIFAKIENELHWNRAFNALPEYTYTGPQKRTIPLRNSGINAVILLLSLTIFISLMIYFKSSKPNNFQEKTTNQFANSTQPNELIAKSFEEFCLEHHINCENLSNPEIHVQWENNRASYLLTKEAMEQYGTSDALQRQLIRLQINQTEIISQLLNDLQT